VIAAFEQWQYNYKLLSEIYKTDFLEVGLFYSTWVSLFPAVLQKLFKVYNESK
jgi:hypothetical protein